MALRSKIRTALWQIQRREAPYITMVEKEMILVELCVFQADEPLLRPILASLLRTEGCTMLAVEMEKAEGLNLGRIMFLHELIALFEALRSSKSFGPHPWIAAIVVG